jgi:hypothetical protein
VPIIVGGLDKVNVTAPQQQLPRSICFLSCRQITVYQYSNIGKKTIVLLPTNMWA